MNPCLHGAVIVGNFFELNEQESANDKFDTVIGDIWLDVVKKYLPDFQRFRSKALKLIKPSGKIIAWGQDCFEHWEKE